MADPLSITASIIAVLQLTSTVVEYINKVHDGGTERTLLLNETKNLKTVLRELQDLIEESSTDPSWKSSVQDLNGRGGPLEICKLALKRLVKVLNAGDENTSDTSTVKKKFDKISTALKWPFKSGEVAATVQVLERQKTYFLIAVQMDVYKLSKKILEDEKANKIIFQEMTNSIGDIHGNVKDVLEELRSQNEIEILRWLSPLKPESKHHEIQSRRFEGTAQWFLEDPIFTAWHQATPAASTPSSDKQSAKSIYCYGIQGAGKSFISSLVIDHLSEIYLNSGFAFAYIYCDYRNQTSDNLGQTVRNIVGAIIRQLLAPRLDLPQSLVDLYRKDATGGRPIQLSDLEEVAVGLCNERKTFLIIDAMDECDSRSHRKGFLRFLKLLNSSSRAQIFLTSRPDHRDIEKFAKDLPRIIIRSSANDVGTYLSHKIKEMLDEEDDDDLNELFDNSLREEIVEKLVLNSEGMFLLPDLQLRTVLEKINKADIRAALQTLPHTLSTEFEATIERIKSQAPERSKLAMRTLMWVNSVLQPLTVAELRHALGVEKADKGLKDERLTPMGILRSSMLDFCHGLIQIEEDSDTVRLVHYSLQEYLEEVSDNLFPDRWNILAECSLTYLLFDEFSDGPLADDKKYEVSEQLYPFYGVAATQWGVYTSNLGARPSELSALGILDLARELLFNVQRLDRVAQAEFVRMRPKWRPEGFSQGYPAGQSPLHLCALYCLWPLMEDYLVQGLDPNARVKHGWHEGETPLHYAQRSYTRHENDDIEMLKLLVKSGADVNAKDLYFETALHCAATAGNMGFMQELLENNADLEPSRRYGGTPFFDAVHTGQVKCVSLLLEKGANLEVQNYAGDTLLCFACSYSDLEHTVELLLKKGADPKAFSRNGWTPMHFAAEVYNERILSLLLQYGADIDARSKDDGVTPLMTAILAGSKIDWFINNKADVDVRDVQNRGPLSVAASNCRESVVTTLLENGADVNGRFKHGMTALFSAVMEKHEPTIVTLLNANIDLEATNDAGEPVLHASEILESPYITRLLLEHGASVDSQCKHGTALHHIANLGSAESDETLQLLIDSGAKTSSVDNYGSTPLHLAIEVLNEKKVEILLRAGVDLEKVDGQHRTVMELAVMFAPELIRLLFDHGASLNCRTHDNSAMSLLHLACRNGDQDVNTIKFLVQEGLDPNEGDAVGNTALIHATRHGGLEVLKILLEYSAAGVNRPSELGHTALFEAMYFENMKLVPLLLDYGASLESNSTHASIEQLLDGRTTLMIAVELGTLENVVVIVERGCNIHAIDRSGKTALLHAVLLGRFEMVKFLIHCGANIRDTSRRGNTIMHYVARSGNVELARYILDRTNLIDSKSNRGRTPLSDAVFEGFDSLVSMLIDRGADPRITSLQGSNLLHLAACHDYVSIAQTLIENGVPLEQESKIWGTPLLAALHNGSKMTASLLIEHGANVLVAHEGFTTLHLSARMASEIMVQIIHFHSHGSLTNKKSDNGTTPLFEACRSSNLSVVKKLLDFGAIISKAREYSSGGTAVHEAAKNGDIDMLKILVDWGANPDYNTILQGTPLFVAIDNSHREVALYLMNNGADVDAKCGEYGRTPLHAAVSRRHIDLVEKLLDHGAKVDDTDYLDETALSKAALMGYDRLALLLIDRGADINNFFAGGETALTMAVASDNLEHVLKLMDKGADINPHLRTIRGGEPFLERIITPAEVACAENYESLAKTLVELGADLKNVSRGNRCLRAAAGNGNTNLMRFLIEHGAPMVDSDGICAALSDALLNGRHSAVLFLLEHGANLSQVTPRGRTTLHIASMSGNMELIEMLLDRGVDPNITDHDGKTAKQLELQFSPYMDDSDDWSTIATESSLHDGHKCEVSIS